MTGERLTKGPSELENFRISPSRLCLVSVLIPDLHLVCFILSEKRFNPLQSLLKVPEHGHCPRSGHLVQHLVNTKCGVCGRSYERVECVRRSFERVMCVGDYMKEWGV